MQLIVKGELVGGLDVVQEVVSNGELRQLQTVTGIISLLSRSLPRYGPDSKPPACALDDDSGPNLSEYQCFATSSLCVSWSFLAIRSTPMDCSVTGLNQILSHSESDLYLVLSGTTGLAKSCNSCSVQRLYCDANWRVTMSLECIVVACNQKICDAIDLKRLSSDRFQKIPTTISLIDIDHSGLHRRRSQTIDTSHEKIWYEGHIIDLLTRVGRVYNNRIRLTLDNRLPTGIEGRCGGTRQQPRHNECRSVATPWELEWKWLVSSQ